MIVTYLRSSSISTWGMCPHQWYLEYSLGIKGKPRWRTEIGSMVHKALELLARRKVAEQDGKTVFFDEELDKEYSVNEIAVESACRIAFEHYAAKNLSQTEWTEEHHADVVKNVLNVVNHGNGEYNPLNRDILSPELYFDLELSDQPWAWHSYKDPHTGGRIEGFLRLKGAIDLVTRVDNETLEYCDWKSGRMYDWAKQVDKGWDQLTRDPQLLLYFLALTRLFPDYKYILVTIFYSRERAPWTIPFERDKHTKLALEIIRETFEAIRNTGRPKRIWDNPKKRYATCTSFCHFGTTNHPDTGRPLCEFYHRELQELGLERAMKKHSKAGAHSRYGSGGGQENRDG